MKVLKFLLITVLLAGMASAPVFAQKGKSKNQPVADTNIVLEEALPEEVLKAFKKKYATAEEPIWHYYKEKSLYRVDCIARSIPTSVSFTETGVWVEAFEEWETDRLPSVCKKSIDLFYQDYQVNSVRKQLTDDKNDVFIVGIFEKQNVRKKLETKVYLDKSGKYIRSEEHDVANSGELSEEIDKKQLKEEKKFQKEFEKGLQMNDAPVKFSEDELPMSVRRWVVANYPDYVFKEISYDEFDEFEQEGSVYRILIQRNGINQPYATAWFTRNGDFLKVEDEFKKEEETPEIDRAETTQTQPTPVEKPKPQVNQAIADTFAVKYPRAKNVLWQEDEDGNWVASYTDQYGENEVVFSVRSGEWMYTKTLLPDVNKIPSAIRTHLEKNYPKAQLTKGWSVKMS
ncbi:MAG: hypothetical protein LBQ64_02325, partial [Bacteroidales bacterium]|nr:hypothetical protein [Bacteroidales bacterium]